MNGTAYHFKLEEIYIVIVSDEIIVHNVDLYLGETMTARILDKIIIIMGKAKSKLRTIDVEFFARHKSSDFPLRKMGIFIFKEN